MTDQIKVTNYSKGIDAQPLHEILNKQRFSFDPQKNELTINDNLTAHVFTRRPQMRNIPDNKSWFNTNIFHF